MAIRTVKNILPLFSLCFFVELVSSLLTQQNAIGVFREDRWIIILFFYINVSAVMTLMLLFVSLLKCKQYTTPETGDINIICLWKDILRSANLIAGFFILSFLFFGITSTANFVWIYRQYSTVWYDELLFGLESSFLNYIPIFNQYINSFFFDKIYQSLWIAIFIALSLVHIFKPLKYFVHIATTVIIAFVMTRLIGICFPTAGPIFYKPEIFDVAGTASEFLQNELKHFMAKKNKSQLLYPGTMAMPSLHVGLSYLVLIVCFNVHRLTLLVTFPFFILTWGSTVILGWHYVIDGMGGILVMQISSNVSRFYNNFFYNILFKVRS